MLISGGEEIAVDARRGLAYLRLSVEANNPVGQTLLGIAYLRGRAGLTQDTMTALELFLKAADQGWSEAQLHLGLLFLGTHYC
ncbi:unnamed protein product [Protopolystoma xenopodis]|uniref:Sel1 repeat family protein n=1 Tax=Protopolystoma xenopodis TaxID=117903 RepID=A0A3S5B8E8_9PLAT|nr:unnamed protein product [Protopolystoma xenopodis]